MKLDTFNHGDIAIRHIVQRNTVAAQSGKTPLIIALTNPGTRDGYTELIFTLNAFKSAVRLFVANDHELRKGKFLMKKGELVIRDALSALIEQVREEYHIDCADVYLLGYCGAAFPVFHLCLEHGYKGVVSMFRFDATFLSRRVGESAYIDDFYNRYMSRLLEQYLPPDYTGEWELYVGRDLAGFNQAAVDRISKIMPENIKKAKFWLQYGRGEEIWNIYGQQTLEELRRNNINFELHIDEEDYEHFSGPSFFTRYVTSTLKSLGIE